MKAIFGVMVTVAAIFVGLLWTNANYGNEAENEIKAQYENMENVLAQNTLKIQNLAQIPGMKTDDLKGVMREAMGGRYGPNGSKAVFQWIKEAYPGQVTDALYVQIQQVMEASQNEFKNYQTKFIDTKRVYTTNLGYILKGFFLRLAGYPKIDLSKYIIISNDSAKEAFKTGVDKPIKLR
jgi:hypothetical protein